MYYCHLRECFRAVLSYVVVVESLSESESGMEPGQNTGSGELGATSGSTDIDTTSEHLPPLGDPTVLYMKTDSNSSLANLTTHPNFGALVEVEGEYTCIAANQHGNFTKTISVDVIGKECMENLHACHNCTSES